MTTVTELDAATADAIAAALSALRRGYGVHRTRYIKGIFPCILRKNRALPWR